ncbi:MAG: PhzF family phenazine biosynthesis protein [Anaerovoracaceae bacterium]
MKFYIVDAFSTMAFGGNPAGVVILDEGADFPSDETMVKTAAELRYSETAFIKQISDEEFNIRYFTPAAEVDLCGHATIASFSALREAGMILPDKTYINNTLAGKLEMEVSKDYIMMEMATPEILGEISDPDKLDELYNIMGINYEEVHIKKSTKDLGLMLPKIVSTGLPDIMMPVANFEILGEIVPDFNALIELSKRYEVVGVHAFAMGDSKVTAHARNFAPLYDIDEEAATGTSNGALTYYLQQSGLLGDNDSATIVQGEKMGRPSSIRSHIRTYGDQTKIQVGGTGVILAEGKIFI